jgi:hypothetical protein
MYRRPKFLEILHEIREEMSGEANYDVDLFAELVRNGKGLKPKSVDRSLFETFGNESFEDDTLLIPTAEK